MYADPSVRLARWMRVWRTTAVDVRLIHHSGDDRRATRRTYEGTTAQHRRRRARARAADRTAGAHLSPSSSTRVGLHPRTSARAAHTRRADDSRPAPARTASTVRTSRFASAATAVTTLRL